MPEGGDASYSWLELLAGLVLVGVGIVLAPGAVFALLGVLLLVLGVFVAARDISRGADRAAGALVVFGLIFLVVSGATVGWIPIVAGLVFLWLGRTGGLSAVSEDRRAEREMTFRAARFEAQVARNVGMPNGSDPGELPRASRWRRKARTPATTPSTPGPDKPAPPVPPVASNGDGPLATLSAEERATLSRLSVFAGGYTRDWERVITSTGGAEAPAMQSVLASLLDQGFLEMAEDATGTERYRIRDPWQAQASKDFARDSQADEIRRRFYREALYIAEIAASTQRASGALSGLHPEAHAQRLEREYANLRAALAWSVGQTGEDHGTRLAAALWNYWWSQAHSSDLREWVRASLARMPMPPRTEALVFALAADLASRDRDYALAKEYATRRLERSRAAKDRGGIVMALLAVGDICLGAGELALAIERFEEVMKQTAFQEKYPRALAWRGIGRACLRAEDFTRAREAFGYQLEAARALSNASLALNALQGLADVALQQEDILAASADIDGALERLRMSADRASLGGALFSAGVIRAAGGDFKAARALMEESLAIAMEFGDRQMSAGLMGSLATLATARREDDVAKSMFEEALRLSRETENKDILERTVLFMLQMAEVMRQRRALEEATALCERAEEVARDTGLPDQVVRALVVHGRVLMALGKPDDAGRRLEEALARARELGSRFAVIGALLGLGHLSLNRGDVAGARTRFEECLRTLEGVRATQAGLLPLAYGFMLLCAREGRGEQAAVLAAALARLSKSGFHTVWDVAPPPPAATAEEQRRSFRVEVLGKSGADLPDETLAASWEKGWSMNIEELREFLRQC